MADFNLSAAISLQLAQGAVAGLKKQIQDGFKAPLVLTDVDKAEKEIKKVKKKVEDPIVVPISFAKKELKEQKDKLTKSIGAVEIDVVFSKSSVRNDLSNKALKEMIGDRKITVPISVKFDKSTEENLKAIKAQLRELNILRKEIEGNAKKGGGEGDLLPTDVKVVVDTNIPQVENEVDILIKRLDLLADKAREVAKSGGTIGKDFFGKSQGAINKLLENVGGVEELNRRFAGLNDQNAANLTAALKTMFRATLNLDRQKTKLQALKAELGDAFDISTATKQLKDSQENIEGFFYSMDASVPAAFSASVQDELSKASQATSKFVSTSKTDIRAYNRLINSLEKEERKAQTLGAGQDKLTEIRSFISDLKSLRQGGASFTLFESTFAVDSLKEIVGSLRLAKILGDQAADSINNIGVKLDKGSLKDTFGGKATDLAGKSSTLRSGAATQITSAVASENVGEIKNIRAATFAQQAELENRAKAINTVYKKIESQADQFARNPALVSLGEKLRTEVIPELAKLAGSADSTELVMQKINKAFNDVIDTKKFAVTVDNAIRKIKTLKDSINNADKANLGRFLDEAEQNIGKREYEFYGANDVSSFETAFNGILNKADGLKKINDEIANTQRAFSAAGETSKDSKVGQIYKDEAQLYSIAATSIINSADSVEGKLAKLKATRVAAFGNVKNSIQTGASSLIDSIKQLSIEAEAYQSASGGSAAGGGNGFFGFAQQAIDQLKTSIGGAEQINKRFAGLTGDAKNNLLSAVRTVFRAFVDLNSQQDKLERTAKTLGPGFKIDDQIAVINDTKTALLGLLTTYDAVDPSAFAASTSREMKKASDSTGSFVRSGEAGARDYEKALISLNQQLANARASGSRDNRVKIFEDLIAKVKELRADGKSINEIRSDSSVQTLSALAQALGFVGINADRSVAALEKLQNKINSGELKNTIGGKIVGLSNFSSKTIPTKISEVNNLNASGGNDRNKQINKVVADTTVQYSVLEARAAGLNSIFNTILNQIDQFRANPAFTKLADDLERRLIPGVTKFAQQGKSLEAISRAVNKELANAINSKGFESKVNTAVNQLQRLKNALTFSGAEDVIGAIAKVDKAIADLQGRVGDFANLTPDGLNNNISKTLFDVRAAQKFNEQVDATAGKLRLIGQADQSLEVGLLYEQQAAKFEVAAKAIAGSSDNVTQKLRKLQQLSKETLINAKFDAEGGFFGSVAKSAGLAAKRLGAFLILAQGLYGVQSLLTTALQDAVKIDREFIKLEQVFNKDFTGAALSKNLSNIKAQITDLGKTLGISTLEIANAGQILAQAGVQGKDLEKLLGTVAKSQLGPSFGSATETAEAAIAIFRQFNLTADQTRDALGGINRVSAKYAVEAEGITEAVRRAGGVFSTSGDQIAGFAASFTLIKQQTREADESIATALRNVAQRLQSSKVQDYLKKTLGIDLVEGGQFVGFEQAITRIGQAIKGLGINEGSPLFSQIREQIAGRLQAGRITPLLQDYDQYQKIVEDFAKGARSIDEDVAVAFNSIENKLQRARSAVTELFTEIIQSPFVKVLVEGFTQMTLVVTNLLKIMNSVPGAIIAIGTAMKIVSASNARLIMSLGISQIVSKIKLPNIAKRNKGGGTDGYYPGAGPNKDSFLTALTRGEFVFSRDAVQEYGVPMLDAMNKGALHRNKGGVIPGFNKGGVVGGAIDFVKLISGFTLLTKTLEKLSDIVDGGAGKAKRAQEAWEAERDASEREYMDRGTIDFNKERDRVVRVGIDEQQSSINTYKENIKNGTPIDQAKKQLADDNISNIRGTQEKIVYEEEDFPDFTRKSTGRRSNEAYNNRDRYKFAKERGASKESLLSRAKEMAAEKAQNRLGAKVGPTPSAKSSTSINDGAKKALSGVGKLFNDTLVKPASQAISKLNGGISKVFAGIISGIVSLPKAFNEMNASIDAHLDDLQAQANDMQIKRDPNERKWLGVDAEQRNNQRHDDLIDAGEDPARVKESLARENIRVIRKQQDDAGRYNYSVVDGNATPANTRSDKAQRISQFYQLQKQGGATDSELLAFSQERANKKKARIMSARRASAGSTANTTGVGGAGTSIGKSVGPLSGTFKELINTISNTKKGLVGVATAGVALQILFGQFESALSQLVLAMVSGAASIYGVTQLPNSVKSVTDFLGVDTGARKKAYSKGIGEKFNAGRNLLAGGETRTLPVVGPKIMSKGGPVGSTDDILAAVRKGGAGPGTRAVGAARSTGAIANSTAAATQGLAGTSSKLATLAKYGAKLTKGLSVGAIVVGALGGAFSYFTDKAEESAKEGVKGAGSLEEAQSIGSKGRFVKLIKSPIDALFSTLSGAITGASVGALSGNPIGVAIGAIVGGITGLFPSIKGPLESIFSKMSSFFSGVGEAISNNTPSFIKDAVSAVYGVAKDIAVGAKEIVVGTGLAIKEGASKVADLAYAAVYSQEALDNSKSEDARSFRVAQIGKRFENKKGPVARVNANEIQDLGVSVGFADELIKQRQAEAKAGGKKGNFEDLSAEDQEKATAEVQAFADVFKNAGAENQKIMIDAYKKMGIDVEELARTVGVDIGYAEIKAKAAFDELSLFFSNMQKSIEFSGARLTGLDAGLDFYSDPKKQQLIPPNFLDILKEGIDPSTLGLGDTFKNAIANTEMLIGGFDKKLAQAGDFEISGRRIARSTSDAITSNPNLKLDPDNAQAFLTDSFAQGGAGPELLQAFDKFLTSDPERSKAAIDEKTGQIDAGKINELFKEFADTLDNGAIEQIKRLIDISNKFVDQYKKAMEDRFAIEGQINDLLLASADKRKTIFDIDNKAKGLTGDKLAQAQGQQALAIDQERLGTILSGTGLGGNANVQQMQAALLASQSRGANAAQVADREGLSGAAAVTRKAEIESIEEERQKRLKAGLTSVAGVTESSTHAMEQFERALQKAANSSKFLTDALLGSDDQIAQTYKGMQAFAKIQQAYAQGGTGAAQATLATFNEDARQALNANIGSDEEKQAKFLEFIGRPTTDISNGPEAKAAKGAVQNQQAAGEALGTALKDDLTRLSKNTEDMKAFYATQFTNTQQIVQQAEATAKQLVNQIASLPQVITHEGNINVNLIGAGALAQLDEAISTMVQKRMAVEIEKNNKNLKENNAGLNVPVPVQQNQAK